MSRQLTREQKLFGLVIDPRFKDSQICALARAWTCMYTNETGPSDLHDVGAALGFNECETRGIMCGWDTTMGAYNEYSMYERAKETSLTDFNTGFQVGKYAAQLVKGMTP